MLVSGIRKNLFGSISIDFFLQYFLIFLIFLRKLLLNNKIIFYLQNFQIIENFPFFHFELDWSKKITIYKCDPNE